MAYVKNRTYEQCLETARPYPSAGEWVIAVPGASRQAYREGWINLIRKEMKWVAGRHLGNRTYKQCLRAAAPFKSLIEWFQKDNKTYQCAYKNGWQRKIGKAHRWKMQKMRGSDANNTD